MHFKIYILTSLVVIQYFKSWWVINYCKTCQERGGQGLCDCSIKPLPYSMTSFLYLLFWQFTWIIVLVLMVGIVLVTDRLFNTINRICKIVFLVFRYLIFLNRSLHFRSSMPHVTSAPAKRCTSATWTSVTLIEAVTPDRKYWLKIISLNVVAKNAGINRMNRM